MKQKIINILKTLASDVRQAAVPSILILLFGGSAGLLLFSQRALDFSIQLATTPTPLWATIALVLLFYGYSYERHKRKTSTKVQIPLFNPQYDIKSRLEPIKEKLLLYVAHNEKIDMYSLSATTNISEPVIKFHLNDLKSKKLISSQSNVNEYLDEIPGWSITQLGLTYLNHHEMLK